MTVHRRRRNGGSRAEFEDEDERPRYSVEDLRPQPVLPQPLILQESVADTIIRMVVVHLRVVVPPLSAFSIADLTEVLEDLRGQIEHVTRNYTDGESRDDDEEGD
jgi:hypothetical protein